MFISFEGGEGSGKSTQSKLLVDALTKSGKVVEHTREPGGTDSAEEIRRLLVEGEVDRWEKLTEVLLHVAARNEHLNRLILPSLKAGKIVITDRFIDSTLVYQGYGHGVDIDVIDGLHDLIIKDIKPDITFILDIDPKEGIERTKGRDHDENRYEKMAFDFHKKVREGYLAIAKKEPKRCVLLDARRPIEDIHAEIVENLDKRIDLRS